MSASEPPTPDELAREFPLTPEQADAFADAMTPVQDITGVGSSIGSALENAPGAGLPFLGTLLQQASAQADLASVSAETLARALEFYIASQTQTAEELFPPPEQLVAEAQRDAEPVFDLLRNPGEPLD